MQDELIDQISIGVQIRGICEIRAFKMLLDELEDQAATAMREMMVADVDTLEGRAKFRQLQVDAQAYNLLMIQIDEWSMRGVEAGTQLDAEYE